MEKNNFYFKKIYENNKKKTPNKVKADKQYIAQKTGQVLLL